MFISRGLLGAIHLKFASVFSSSWELKGQVVWWWLWVEYKLFFEKFLLGNNWEKIASPQIKRGIVNKVENWALCVFFDT